jgi:hypothetical protein
MSLLDPTSIPGYADACAQEQANRDLSFLPWPLPLCGLVVSQFTLRHLILLGECGNAFTVDGKTIEPEDVAGFLWFVSPDYSPGPKARDRFVKKIRDRVVFLDAVQEINAYLDAALQDAPATSQRGGKVYFSAAASFVDLFAAEYGWSVDVVLNTPIAALFQLLRCIQRRHDPRAIMFNRSDQILSKMLRERMGMN